MREIDLSLLLDKSVVINVNEQSVSVFSLASKNDFSGNGVWRTLGCLCGDGDTLLPCPYHIAIAQKAWLQDRGFGDGPFFPTVSGGTCEKPAVVAVIEAFAKATGVETVSPGGDKLFGGHSLRTGRAVWLHKIGIDLSRI